MGVKCECEGCIHNNENYCTLEEIKIDSWDCTCEMWEYKEKGCVVKPMNSRQISISKLLKLLNARNIQEIIELAKEED